MAVLYWKLHYSEVCYNEVELYCVCELCLNTICHNLTDSDSVMVRASALGARGRGLDPGPGHTKDFKNVTSGYLAWRSAL